MEQKPIKFNYTPHTYQQEIHKSCSPKSPNLWTVVCAGRQSGKSEVAKYQAITWAMTNEKSLIWYVTPSESQSKVVYRAIANILQPMGLIKSKNQSKGNIMIEFHNGTRIEFKSAASEDNLRGSSVDFLILDEAAFIKQNTIEEIIIPTLSVSGKKILIISTPKGKNYFYELWLRGEKGVEGFKSFKFNSFDNPYHNKALIESFKNSLAEGIYLQEFMAEWLDSASVFTNIYELACLNKIYQPVKGDKYYIGVDIALKGDWYVMTVLNQNGEMVYIDRVRDVPAPELIKRIEDAYYLWKPKELTIEANNQGLPIIQHLRKIPAVKGFNTTSDSKSDIINQLIAAFSGREIRILNNEDLKTELNSFIFEYSKTGKVKFHAATGHDDMVMSLAIAYDNFLRNKTRDGYLVFTDEKPPLKLKGGLFIPNRGIGDIGGDEAFDSFKLF